jgi:hypothetical protein
LGTGECARLIAGTGGLNAEQLVAALNKAEVTVGDSAPGNGPVKFTTNADGTVSYTYQWAYTMGGNIQLNSNFFPDPTLQNIEVPGVGTKSFLDVVNNTLGSELNAQQLGTLVFLHELSHIANHGTDIDTNAYNQSIIATCIH